MFRDRDRKPKRELVPWAGEFIGKFLIGAQQLLTLTGDPELYALIDRLVDELLPLQSDDGYLGPFPREERLVMHWDVWGHYHVMQALLMYHERTGCDDSLDVCRRMADLLHDFFVQGKRRMVTDSDADGEKNYAVIHSVIWLYRLTGEERHLELARWIESEWEEPPAGDYVREALSGKPVWEFPVKRWESLHDHQGIAELALLTGDVKYETAYKHIWWSMVEGDRHNDGGFTSSEACCGNPYDLGAIETCCTLAWIAHSIDMLRLTRDSRVADEIELSTLNGMIGAQHPSGRWWTYNTPMDGTRKASQHDIVFQARAGSPEFNCCSANAARGIGMISEWAVMTTESGIALNYYGPGEIAVELRDGTPVSIVQETYYPLDGAVTIRVNPETPSTFPLELRIPGWSAETTVTLNGEAVSAIPGEYLRLDREWAETRFASSSI
jgi:uncharacterized protein